MISVSEKIKAVAFDWGGVCCSGAEPFASQSLQQAVGLTPEKIAVEVKDIYLDYYRGVYTQDTFWRAVLHYFRLAENENLNPAVFLEAYRDSYVVYEDVLAMAKSLRSRYRTGLISNLTSEMRDHIRRAHHLDDYFDVQVFSCDSEVAEVKPADRPYERLLEKLVLTPQQVVFIDDNASNIEAAKKMGFETILFTNRAAALDELKTLL